MVGVFGSSSDISSWLPPSPDDGALAHAAAVLWQCVCSPDGGTVPCSRWLAVRKFFTASSEVHPFKSWPSRGRNGTVLASSLRGGCRAQAAALLLLLQPACGSVPAHLTVLRLVGRRFHCFILSTVAVLRIQRRSVPAQPTVAPSLARCDSPDGISLFHPLDHAIIMALPWC